MSRATVAFIIVYVIYFALLSYLGAPVWATAALALILADQQVPEGAAK